jgi:hypothetical protein
MPVADSISPAVPAGAGGTRRGMRQFLFLSAIFFGAVAASLAILKYAPVPFFWLGIMWASAFFLAIFCVQGSWPRAILFNLGVFLCVFAAAEAYFFYSDTYRPPTVTEGLYVQDDLLGWAPAKGMHATSIELGPGGLFHQPAGVLFDVKYTIDSDGLRIAPPYRQDDLLGAVLFFGCSFTFGEGLQDNQTLPYQVGAQSGGRYRTFNLAFNGYSPIQMLAAIDSGMLRRIADTTPRYVYYVAIPQHVWRVAGRIAWIQHQPRYVLDASGGVQRSGYFEDYKPLSKVLGIRHGARQLKKSAIWRILELRESGVTEDDMRLYLALVRRSRDLLVAQYPGVQFRIILWPGHSVAEQRTYEGMRDGFRRMDLPLDLVEDILPGYKTDETPYVLSSADTHPSALANRLIAQHIVNETLQGSLAPPQTVPTVGRTAH